jgi:Na+-transporting NADH:ubiquinone oxidoreductase subunit A
VPRSIFVNGMNTEPLSADITLVMLNQKDNFRAGMKVLHSLTAGKIYLSVAPGVTGNIEAFRDNPGVIVTEFSGPHPAGTHSVHIHNLERLRKGETVWTINAYQVTLIGKLFLDGVYPSERVIAVGGSGVKEPQHYLTRVGSTIESILGKNIHEGTMRYIMGSVLTGTQTTKSGYVSFMNPDITVIPEGKKRDFLGWMTPGAGALSFSRAFLSALSPNATRSADTNIHGSLRAIVASDVYDRYFPLDIYTVPLIKSVIGQDTEKAEKLGILECLPEDFALASFMCPSKIDLCGIIDRGLKTIKKENE